MKLEPYLTPLKKMNLKWIKELNIRSDTKKILEENIRKKPLDTGNDFLDIIAKAQTTNIINKLHGITCW